MKMDSDVLLLSYFDKICLILTGELWRALACLYSEVRLYKGAREAPVSQSTTLHSTGNTSVTHLLIMFIILPCSNECMAYSTLAPLL